MTDAPAGLVLTTSAGEVEAQLRGLLRRAVRRSHRRGLTGGAADPRIVPFRGDYYVLRPERRSLVNARSTRCPIRRFRSSASTSRAAAGRRGLARPERRARLRARGLRPLPRAAARSGRGARLRPASGGWRAVTGAPARWSCVRDYSRRMFVASARRLIPELALDDVLPRPGGHPRPGDRTGRQPRRRLRVQERRPRPPRPQRARPPAPPRRSPSARRSPTWRSRPSRWP